MAENVAWGLDIGQTAIHAVKLTRGKGRNGPAVISDVFFYDLDSTIDDPAHEEKVEEALQEFMRVKRVGNTPVVVSLPGYTVLFRYFPLPAVGGSQIDEIVSYEAKQLIPYPLDEVEWDYRELGEDEETGEVEIGLICCRRDIVEDRLAMMDEVGFNVEALQVGPIGLVNYVMYDTPPEGVALILDAGARSTDFIMVNENSFWLRSIGVSGTDLSRTLMNKFSISFEEAEELKRTMGSGKQGQRAFRIIEPTLRNLCGEITRSIGYYKSQFRGVDLSEVICAGNTFLLDKMDQFMADNLGYPARVLQLPETLSIDARIDKSILSDNRQVLGIATGLALQGIGQAQFEMSLLPEARRMQKLIRAKEKYGWIMAALVVAAVLLSWVTTDSKKPRYEQNLAEMDEVMEKAEHRLREYNDVLRKFDPAKNVNDSMVELPQGRGWLVQTSEMIDDVVRSINNERFAQMNPNPVEDVWSVKALATAKTNMLENIKENDQDRELYQTWLAEATERYQDKIDAESNPDERRKVVDNIQLQVLRRVLILHNRRRKFFFTNSKYQIVQAAAEAGAAEEGVRPTFVKPLEIKDLFPAAEGAAAPGRRGPGGWSPSQPGGYPRPGQPGGGQRGDLSAPAAEGPEQPVLWCRIEGYCVSTEAEEVLYLRNQLNRLPIQMIEFKINRPGGDEVGSSNTIRLPKIYDPSPKKATDEQMGENGDFKPESEPIEYEAYSDELVLKFSAEFFYQPALADIPVEQLESLVVEGWQEEAGAGDVEAVPDEGAPDEAAGADESADTDE